jgi:glycosyltransferase involved in cell wall biosynthesis
MGVSIGIDGFRLLTAPKTSHATYISDLVTSLSTVGEIDHLHLFIPRRPLKDSSFSELAKITKLECVWPEEECYPERSFRSQVYWVQYVIPRLVRVRASTIDCYIATYHHPPMFLPTNVRVVTVIHDVCGLRSSAGYSKMKKGFYQHLLMFILAGLRSDVLIPISHRTKTEFARSFPFLRRRISGVVYNSVKGKPVTDDFVAANILKKYGVYNKRYFLAFGQPGLRKGLDLILAVCSVYRKRGGQSIFVFIVPRAYRDSLDEELIARGIRDVTMISDIEVGERDALYKGAVALLFLSRCEGFGYPIVEAMRQGCPPIAWHDTPASELIGRDFAVLNSLDSEEIVKQMTDYEQLDIESRLRLSERLTSRSLIFLGDNFGREFFQMMKMQ